MFDVGAGVGQSPTGSEMEYTTRESCIRVLRCHTGRTKRIITEDSPDLFLTVAEVASVLVEFQVLLTRYTGWPSTST